MPCAQAPRGSWLLRAREDTVVSVVLIPYLVTRDPAECVCCVNVLFNVHSIEKQPFGVLQLAVVLGGGGRRE